MTQTAPTNATTPLNRTRLIVTVIGALLGVASIVAILLVMLYVGAGPAPTTGLKTDAERQEILEKRQAEDAHALATAGWVDKNKGVARIPIDLAMRKVIEEAATRPANP